MDDSSDSDFEVNECSDVKRVKEDQEYDDAIVEDEGSVNS
jgi:hypothetical protein